MKVFKYFFALLSVTLFCFGSCQTKQTPIDELDKLVTELKKSDEDLSEKEFEAVMKRYDAITDKFAQYEGQYTQEEMQRIAYLHGQYTARVAKQGLKSMFKVLEDASSTAGSWLKGLSEELKNLEK